ncbi:hypothetical protein Tco_1106145 [Tanacetum coccineum]
MSSNERLQFGLMITGAHIPGISVVFQAKACLCIFKNGYEFVFVFFRKLGRYDNRKKIGFFQEYIFQVIRKRFEFKIRRRFFKRCFDLVIGVKGDFFSNGGSLVSDSDLEFSSAVIALNSSNSAKSFSSRMVPSMEWKISLPSSRRASKSSSKISSMTSILKHVSSFK